jgi:arylmalonate decarboxylase
MIGLIVPPADGKVPPEGRILYPHLKFEAVGLRIPEVSSAGFDMVAGAITAKAKLLASRGAQAISVMGTSLTFYRGAAVNRQIQRMVQDATRLPATTMSDAVVNALRAMRVTRVTLATAYIDDLNHRLERFLREEDFDIAGIKGMALTEVRDVQGVKSTAVKHLARAAFEMDRSADGILISCGGLLTLDIIDALEAELGVPVVASSPAGFWDVVRLAGKGAPIDGFGRLFTI